MTYTVKEAECQDGIFWIEKDNGDVVCNFFEKIGWTHKACPNAKANAEWICGKLNEREETK